VSLEAFVPRVCELVKECLATHRLESPDAELFCLCPIWPLTTIFLEFRDVTRDAPIVPPITPPTACNPAQPATPPHSDSAGPVMKNAPIMNPAMAAERVEMMIAMIAVLNAFLKKLLNPVSAAVKSNTKAAAVKPKNVMAWGFNAKFMMVAISPMEVMAPNFLIHQAATVRIVNPIKSQSRGRCVMLKTMGEKIELSTPHKAAHNAIAAMSRLLK